MARMVWLSTLTSLRVCSSIAQAVALGKPGDHVHAMSTDGVQPAAKASHVIRATKSGRKVAVRLAPVLRPCMHAPPQPLRRQRDGVGVSALVARRWSDEGFVAKKTQGGQVVYEKGMVRVCPDGEEGTDIHVFSDKLGYTCAYSMHFSGSTPVAIVIAAANAASEHS